MGSKGSNGFSLGFLGSPAALLGLSRALLGHSWALLGFSWSSLELSWALLGSWGSPGLSWTLLGSHSRATQLIYHMVSPGALLGSSWLLVGSLVGFPGLSGSFAEKPRSKKHVFAGEPRIKKRVHVSTVYTYVGFFFELHARPIHNSCGRCVTVFRSLRLKSGNCNNADLTFCHATLTFFSPSPASGC
jgi:hypothetical protein